MTPEERRALRLARDLDDRRAVLATPAGRRFARRILHEICGINRSTYLMRPTGQPTDLAFAEGGRNVGLVLLEELRQADAAALLEADREAFNDPLLTFTPTEDPTDA